MTQWVVYIIKCNDDSLYTGITTDLSTRLASHEAGTGAKYTRGRGPFRLVFQEQALDRGAATRRENQIKALGTRAKRRLISRQ
mgnify:FL=1